jgi:hypothetical protein
VSERTFKGRTYQSITKATPANDVARSNAVCAAAADGESQFVGAVLAGLIGAGHVAYDKKELYDATQMLRGLYGATFGGRRNGKTA